MPTVVAEAPDLISKLCLHFSQIAGWKLQFIPSTRAPREMREQLEKDEGCAWFSELGDSSRTAGFLRLDRHEHDITGNFVEAVALAESLSLVLGRLAKASSQLNQRNRDVATLLDLGLAIPAQDDLAFSLAQLLKAAVHLTGSWSAAFFLLDPSTERLRLRAIFRLAREDVPEPFRDLRSGSIDLQALADEPVVLKAKTPGDHPLLPAAMRTSLCTAVQSETVPFGTLWVYDRRAKEFSQRDIHVLQSIAAQIAAVLERSALLRGSEQDERVNRDLKAASESQPDSIFRDLPKDPRFELAGRCTSCYELGGDLCEVIPLSPDRTAIAVGDASGNSIPAAMIMSMVRGALRTYPADEPQITDLLFRLNAALCNTTRAHQFMSLCYGVYDAARRTFAFSDAGHPVPLLVRDGQATALESHGLLLGVMPEANYQHSVLELRAGDLIVFYSDGITEARSSAQDLFRWEGISAAILGSTWSSAADVLDTVWRKVDEHVIGGEAADDRTLLVLKVL